MFRRSNIYHNSCAKIYSNGMVHVTVSNSLIFREAGFEEVSLKDKESKPQNPDSDSRDDSVRRAKGKIFDISLENRFSHFITWTLDGNKIDRYDSKVVREKLMIFLNNMAKRYDLKYLIIPEYHKDGAIHMHGLISGNMKYVDSGHETSSGRTIYNMPQWKYGWSTAIEIYNQPEAVCKYITKYVTKDSSKIFGNFYYAGGRGLVRDVKKVVFDSPYNLCNSKEYLVPLADLNLGFKYLTDSGEYLKKYNIEV